MKRSVLRRAGAFAALAAMLVLVVAPLLSTLLAPSAPMTLVCTADGLRAVPLGDGQSPSSNHTDRCVHCLLQGLAALPGASPGYVAPSAVALDLPAVATPIPRPRVAWASAQPRGPPA